MPPLDSIEQALRDQPDKPPIEKWHPALSGDIDIHIDNRGDWYHEGERFQRHALIKLFASILRREDDGEYYLITPVEKWCIRVDDTPLLAVDMEIVEPGAEQKIIFRLNTDELIFFDQSHPVRIENADENPRPILTLERGLCARLTTSVFYRLVDAAVDENGTLTIRSGGETHRLT